jgi:hypothetical protein
MSEEDERDVFTANASQERVLKRKSGLRENNEWVARAIRREINRRVIKERLTVWMRGIMI